MAEMAMASGLDVSGRERFRKVVLPAFKKKHQQHGCPPSFRKDGEKLVDSPNVVVFVVADDETQSVILPEQPEEEMKPTVNCFHYSEVYLYMTPKETTNLLLKRIGFEGLITVIGGSISSYEKAGTTYRRQYVSRYVCVATSCRIVDDKAVQWKRMPINDVILLAYTARLADLVTTYYALDFVVPWGRGANLRSLRQRFKILGYEGVDALVAATRS